MPVEGGVCLWGLQAAQTIVPSVAHWVDATGNRGVLDDDQKPCTETGYVEMSQLRIAFITCPDGHRQRVMVDAGHADFTRHAMKCNYPIEVKASHLSLISHPHEITNLILNAAGHSG